MTKLAQAKDPFKFYTRLHLSELTGLRAGNIKELLEGIKTVSGSSIYHHTHRFLQQHQYLSPEPPNDFAYWVTNFLGEAVLGEELASIDTIEFLNIRDLRNEIAKIIEAYIKDNPSIISKAAPRNAEFYFIKSISFILPTNYVVNNLEEFVEVLKNITIDSIYFHMFEARLRLERKTNDFSLWIESSLGNAELAKQLSNMDPYTYTLEDLRRKIINKVSSWLK